MMDFMNNSAIVLDASAGVPGAAYVRYSSDLQSETSNIDQTQRCRDAAARQGCVIPEHLLFRDDAVSGRFMKNRPALQRLIAMAKQKPSPFVVLYVDSTSRLGRNISEVLQLAKVLKYNGVFLHIASTGLDSRNPAFEMVLTMMAMMDEVFLSELRAKVRGGMVGQVMRGFHPGGKCYGYRNEREDDYGRREVGGHAPLKGVRQVIDPEEAAIVLLIFKMYAEGNSYERIAKFLNSASILSPQRPRKGGIRSWCPSAIREMLLNERYRGTVNWGMTEKLKNPETAATEYRNRPASEWTTQYHEELRIVSDELWEKVRVQNGLVCEKHGPKKLGGMNRTETSRKYLFSGLLRCGVCGANMVISSGKAPNSFYGCPYHRKRGVCANKLTIKQSSLEEQLLGRIVARLRTPETLALLQEEFSRQVAVAATAEAAAAQKALGSHDGLRKENAALGGTVERLTDAIAQHGLSHALSAKLRQSEARMEEIRHLLAAKDKPAAPKIGTEETAEFLKRKVAELMEVLLGDPLCTKQELLKRIDQLVLTPEVRDGEEVYVVQGDMRLFAANDDVMLTNSGPGNGDQYTPLRITLDGFVLLPTKTLKERKRKEAAEAALAGSPNAGQAAISASDSIGHFTSKWFRKVRREVRCVTTEQSPFPISTKASRKPRMSWRVMASSVCFEQPFENSRRAYSYKV
jgi:DNA invertase Pin-like site-specific DNA recombinase